MTHLWGVYKVQDNHRFPRVNYDVPSSRPKINAISTQSPHPPTKLSLTQRISIQEKETSCNGFRPDSLEQPPTSVVAMGKTTPYPTFSYCLRFNRHASQEMPAEDLWKISRTKSTTCTDLFKRGWAPYRLIPRHLQLRKFPSPSSTGYGDLPQEIREMIMQYAFNSSEPRLWNVVIRGSSQPDSEKADTTSDRTLVVELPVEMSQLFASKLFFREALSVVSRHTILHFQECDTDDVLRRLEAAAPPLLQRFLRTLISSTTLVKVSARGRSGFIVRNINLYKFQHLKEVELDFQLEAICVQTPVGTEISSQREPLSNQPRVDFTIQEIMRMKNSGEIPFPINHELRLWLLSTDLAKHLVRLIRALDRQSIQWTGQCGINLELNHYSADAGSVVYTAKMMFDSRYMRLHLWYISGPYPSNECGKAVDRLDSSE